MKKLLLAVALVGVAAAVASPAQAFGHRRSRCGSSCGEMSCGGYGGSSCGGTYAPGYAPDCGPAYTEQQLNGYRAEMRTRTVPRQVQRVVCREVTENFNYTEMQAVITPQTRKETFYTPVTRQVPYNYTVNVPVMTPQTRQETFYTPVTRQVPYNYTVNVPVMTQQTRMVNYCVNVPQMITEQFPVCRKVPVCCVDPCTGCVRTMCQTITEMQTRTRCVMQPVMQSRDVTYNVCTYQPQQMQGMRTVCDMVPQTRDVTYNVCTYQPKEMQGMRTVCDTVAQTRDVTYNVCTYQPVQRQGTRTRLVADTVTDTVQVTECYTEMVPYTYTVRVPVMTASVPCAPMMTASDSCGSSCYVATACCESASRCGHGHRHHGCR